MACSSRGGVELLTFGIGLSIRSTGIRHGAMGDPWTTSRSLYLVHETPDALFPPTGLLTQSPERRTNTTLSHYHDLQKAYTS
jgi:hypothetical protein